MKKLIIVFTAAMLVSTGLVKAGTWTTVDYPGASQTYIRHLDGSNLVGYYTDSSYHDHGFLFNITAQNWVDLPVKASGIDGDTVVGGNKIYNMATQTLTTLNAPGADITVIYGINGNNLVGTYDGHGFIYDGTTWTTLDKPGAIATVVYGIDGGNIVGCFLDPAPGGDPASLPYYNRGFLYDGTTWTILNAPGKGGTGISITTSVLDISGNNLVGGGDGSGFVYNGTTWTILKAPGAMMTKVWSIDGDKLVGEYQDSSENYHGFVYEIPEPATILLLGLGGLFLRRK